MILTAEMLQERLQDYSDRNGKIKRMKNNGELFPLLRGLYETDSNVPGYLLAGAIYGPSYLSFDYVLSRYEMIPEAVYTYTSATCGKKKMKEYENCFGRFSYRDIPPEVFPFGIVIHEENGYFYRMATPEKALCDKLYTMPPVQSQKEIEKMLFEDLRVDETMFDRLDIAGIIGICEKYGSNNLKCFMKYLGRSRK